MIATKKLLATAILSVITLGLCVITNAQPDSHQHEVHWSYQGEENPREWGKLSPEFLSCDLGEHQSPIDFHDSKPKSLSPTRNVDIEFDYQSVPLEVINNGHTIQVNYSEGSSVKIDGEPYELLQFHFHTPSEHTLGGTAYPMEVHLVHKNSSGEYAVIGMFIAAGKNNPLIAKIWQHLPETGEVETVSNTAIDVNSLLPAHQTYYTYQGSLTTPPCSEGVHWYVMQEPVEASESQIAQFRAIYELNARPVQPIHDRVIQVVE